MEYRDLIRQMFDVAKPYPITTPEQGFLSYMLRLSCPKGEDLSSSFMFIEPDNKQVVYIPLSDVNRAKEIRRKYTNAIKNREYKRDWFSLLGYVNDDYLDEFESILNNYDEMVAFLQELMDQQCWMSSTGIYYPFMGVFHLNQMHKGEDGISAPHFHILMNAKWERKPKKNE